MRMDLVTGFSYFILLYQVIPSHQCNFYGHHVITNCSFQSLVGFYGNGNGQIVATASHSNWTSVGVKLPDIRALYLDHNSLTALGADSFFNMSSLVVLDLSFNNIVNVSQSVFNDLTALEVLNLSRNSDLRYLPDHIFTNLSKLQTLDLSWNNIDFIPDYIFQNAAALNFIDLSHNPLNELPVATFETCACLTYLDLSETNIGMNSSSAMSFLENTLPLEHLHMSFTQLRALDAADVIKLRVARGLKSVDLRSNTTICTDEFMQHFTISRNTTNSKERCFRLPEKCLEMLAYEAPINRQFYGNCAHFIDTNDTRSPTSDHSSNQIQFSAIAEELPYDSKLGWQTAVTLFGILCLFLVFVMLDKLKQRYYHEIRQKIRKLIGTAKAADSSVTIKEKDCEIIVTKETPFTAENGTFDVADSNACANSSNPLNFPNFSKTTACDYNNLQTSCCAYKKQTDTSSTENMNTKDQIALSQGQSVILRSNGSAPAEPVKTGKATTDSLKVPTLARRGVIPCIEPLTITLNSRGHFWREFHILERHPECPIHGDNVSNVIIRRNSALV